MDDMAILTLGTRCWRRELCWVERSGIGMTGMAGRVLDTLPSSLTVCRASAVAIAAAWSSMRLQKPWCGWRGARAGVDHSSARAVYSLAVQGDDGAKRVFAQVGRALRNRHCQRCQCAQPSDVCVGRRSHQRVGCVFSCDVRAAVRLRSVVFAATAPEGSAGAGQGASRHKWLPGGSTRTIITRTTLGSDAGSVRRGPPRDDGRPVDERGLKGRAPEERSPDGRGENLGLFGFEALADEPPDFPGEDGRALDGSTD